MEINKPITTVILLVIAGILLFLFVVPKYYEFQDSKVTLAKKQAEFNGESAYYGKIAEIDQSLNDRKEMLDKIDSSLPVNPALAPLLYFFQKKGNETGLIVKSITFSNAAAPTPSTPLAQAAGANAKKEVKDVVFMVNLAGNYQGLKNFLAGVEKSARLFEVESIALNPLQSAQTLTQSNSKLQTYDVKLQIKTHTY
jgi:Tfp pilus assembly protein PilO